MTKKTGIVYKATSPSGKTYIGQTVSSLKKRIRKHKNDSNRLYYAFARAIKKYGVDNFIWEVLHNNVETKKLNNLEISEIKKHNED